MMEQQTLGAKLAKTLDELEVAKIKSLEEKAAADLAAIRKERQELFNFVSDFRQSLIDTITAGKVPAVKVREYNRQRWIREAIKGTAAHQDIWNELRDWARKQLLIIVTEEGHDGVGVKSWLVLTAHAIRPGTRGV